MFWRIIAKPAVINAQTSEVEGRVILMDEPTLVINRTIQLEEAAQ